MQSRELYFKNHKNARHISASGRWLTARTRNNSSTWLPSAITPEKSGSHSPPCTNTQHEILLFITSCIRGDLLFSRLTGATQVLQNFFALKRKLKAHLLETEDIHFVCADQRTTDKVRNKGAVFSTFTQVPVKATHMLIYKNLFFSFFLGLCVFCVYWCNSIQICSADGGGVKGTPDLLLLSVRRTQSFLPLLQGSQPTNAYLGVKGEAEVWWRKKQAQERKRGRPEGWKSVRDRGREYKNERK